MRLRSLYGRRPEDRYYIAAAIPTFGDEETAAINSVAINQSNQESVIAATSSLRKFIIIILIVSAFAIYSLR